MLDRASRGWRGLTMTPAGLRQLQDPTWLNLVFNVAADFGEGFVQVLGSIQWRPASSIGVSRRPASSKPRPVA